MLVRISRVKINARQRSAKVAPLFSTFKRGPRFLRGNSRCRHRTTVATDAVYSRIRWSHARFPDHNAVEEPPKQPLVRSSVFFLLFHCHYSLYETVVLEKLVLSSSYSPYALLMFLNVLPQRCRSKRPSGQTSCRAQYAVTTLTSKTDIRSAWDVLILCANRACQIYPKSNARLIK